MNREEQIIEASRNPIFKTGLIRIDDISFIAGAQWADRTMLQEVLKWLENGTTDTSDEYANPMVAFITFDYKKQMIQAFKEQFNIE